MFLHATSAGPPGGFETLRRRVRNRRWSCACVVRWGCCVVRMGQPVPCWAGLGHGWPGAERGALMLLLLLALVALFFGRGGGPGRCDGGQEHEAAAASQRRRPLRARRFQAARPKRPPPAVAGTSGHTPAPYQIIEQEAARPPPLVSPKNSSSRARVRTPSRRCRIERVRMRRLLRNPSRPRGGQPPCKRASRRGSINPERPKRGDEHELRQLGSRGRSWGRAGQILK